MMYDQTRAQQPSGQTQGPAERRTPGPEPLLPAAERDRILLRLRHALNTFADTPREALEEAESAYDEATAQLVNALAERRRLLRAGWQDQNPDAQSEELRHALRQYREITQTLLHI
jgi:t-SNARE complex subunit (syntaxin)